MWSPYYIGRPSGLALAHILVLHVFNCSSKTQVSVIIWTHARSQLFPMKQYDHLSIVVTFFLTKNFK